MYVYVCFVYMDVCASYTPSACRSQKSGPLALDLQTVLVHHVSSGNRTQVLGTMKAVLVIAKSLLQSRLRG